MWIRLLDEYALHGEYDPRDRENRSIIRINSASHITHSAYNNEPLQNLTLTLLITT